MPLDRQERRAIQRWGPKINRLARKRYKISGQQLLARLTLGESGGNEDAVSSAGARGRTQFMPTSRQAAIDKYGVDPWGSADDAIHAAVLHLKGKINGSKGLEGYNPGGGSAYVSYILGQNAPKDLARGGSQHPGVTPGRVKSQKPPQTGVADVSALLASLSRETVPVSTGVPQGPAFSARKAPIATSAPVPRGSSLDAVLASASALKGTSLPRTKESGKPGRSRTGGPAPGGKVKGAVHGSPIPGQTPQSATHDTSGLPGYPAFDYMAPAGTKVVSPVNGKIIKLSGQDPKAGGPPGGALGYSLYIKANNGRTYFLTHMGSRSVKLGQRVRAGQRIGTVANGPSSWSSPHIHMGING